MAIVPSLLYRGTLGNTSTTLKTTDSNATTTVTNIVASNRTSTAGWFTVTIGGIYVAYQMPVAGNQTVTIDVKQSIPAGTAIAGLANAASTIDLHISGAVNTGPSDLPWTAYTPTLTASTTNPTNWTQTGYYMQAGKLVMCKGMIQAGASMTTGSGTYRIALPVAANTTLSLFPVNGIVYVSDASAGGSWQQMLGYVAASNYICAVSPSGGAPVSHSFPWSPNSAVGDFILFNFSYEAA